MHLKNSKFVILWYIYCKLLVFYPFRNRIHSLHFNEIKSFFYFVRFVIYIISFWQLDKLAEFHLDIIKMLRRTV